MMNDFFADLDADLGLVPKLPTKPLPEKIITPTISPTPIEKPILQKEYVKMEKPAFEKKAPIVTKVERPAPNSNKAVPKRNSSSDTRPAHFVSDSTLVSSFPQTRFQSTQALQIGSTRIITLGGQNESGKSMITCQYGDEILLIGAGVSTSSYSELGAKYSLPDISSLISQKKKIAGLVVTNAHPEQILGLKHLLPALGYPKIYATNLTVGLIKESLRDTESFSRVSFQILYPETDGLISISPSFQIESFRTIHSIPDSIGIYIESPKARIVCMNESRIDWTSSLDISKLKAMGERGIDLFLGDSAYSMKEWYAKTESDFDKHLGEVISRTSGRIIIATSPTLIGRIQKIIDVAEALRKTVFLGGQDMMDVLGVARDLGYIQHTPNRVKRLTSKVESISLEEQIILTTFEEKGVNSGIEKMALSEHQFIKIQPGDTVILPSLSANSLMNKLMRLGGTIFTLDGMSTASSGHAYKEDQKLILDTLRPYNIMPVHGELCMRIAYKQTALSLWVPDENVFLGDDGTILDIDEQGYISQHKTPLHLEEIIADGYGLWVATSHVMDARSQMMKSGVVTMVYKIDEKTRALLGHLKLETRGLVYLDEVREAHKIIIKKARTSYEETLKDIPDIEEKDLLKIIRRDMEIFLETRMARNPVIIPIFIYV